MNEEQRQELRRLAELPRNVIGDNENNVKYKFIIPFLESFGYDEKLDFEHSAQGNRIDILISTISNDCILIEAKSYGKNLDDYILQLKRYCDEKRPILAIICNGELIRFYSPLWKRKPDFSDTVIYSVTRYNLADDHIVERIEAVLSKAFLEDDSIFDNIEKREKEITEIAKKIDSIRSDYQEEISTLEASISDIEKQIDSLQAKTDSLKAQVADKKREVDRKIEELKDEHFIFVPQPQENIMKSDRLVIDSSPRRKRPKTILSITFPDGTTICESVAAESFLKAIDKVGIEKVRNLAIQESGVPLIASNKTNKGQKQLGNYYVMTGTDTVSKKGTLQEIAEKLGFSLEVKVIGTRL